MTRKNIFLAIALIFGILITGCGKNTDSNTLQPSPSPEVTEEAIESPLPTLELPEEPEETAMPSPTPKPKAETIEESVIKMVLTSIDKQHKELTLSKTNTIVLQQYLLDVEGKEGKPNSNWFYWNIGEYKIFITDDRKIYIQDPAGWQMWINPYEPIYKFNAKSTPVEFAGAKWTTNHNGISRWDMKDGEEIETIFHMALTNTQIIETQSNLRYMGDDVLFLKYSNMFAMFNTEGKYQFISNYFSGIFLTFGESLWYINTNEELVHVNMLNFSEVEIIAKDVDFLNSTTMSYISKGVVSRFPFYFINGKKETFD